MGKLGREICGGAGSMVSAGGRAGVKHPLSVVQWSLPWSWGQAAPGALLPPLAMLLAARAEV